MCWCDENSLWYLKPKLQKRDMPWHVSFFFRNFMVKVDRVYWIHISDEKTPLMYPHRASGYISPRESTNSCIHTSLLDTYLRLETSTHVSTRRFWIHIFAQIYRLMYPPDTSGYTSQTKIHNSCTHPTLLDTRLLPNLSIHVSTRRFWIHIFAQIYRLMYPPHALWYITPLKSFNSCIHPTLLGTYLHLKTTTHVSTRRFWIHISAQNSQLMYPPDTPGYISLLKSNNSCIHPTLLDTHLHLKTTTHVSTSRSWIHIYTQI